MMADADPTRSRTPAYTLAVLPARYPMVGWMALLCAGCAAGIRLPWPHLWAVPAVAAAVAAAVFIRRSRGKPTATLANTMVWLTVFFTALATGAELGRIQQRELAFFHEHVGEPLVVEGNVEVVRRVRSRDGRLRYEIRLYDAVLSATNGAVQPLRVARADMRCNIRGEEWPEEPRFGYGDRWRFTSRRTRANMLFGANGLRAFMFLPADPAATERLPQRAPPLQAGLRTLRDNVAARLGRGVPEEYATELALAKAMLLGIREEIPRDVRTFFRHSGTAHIFAISGLAVGMVAFVLMFLVQHTPLPYEKWGVVMIPAVLLYCVLAGAPPSAVRASLMVALYWAVLLCGGRTSGLATLAAAAVFLVGTNPLNILDIGFWLSFTVTAGLIILTPLCMGLAAYWRADIRLPGRWTWHQALDHKLRASVCVAVSAWIVSTPLSLYFFGQFVPSSILANILVVPLTFGVVCCATAGLATGLVWEQGAAWLNQLMILVVRCMRGIATFFACPPFGAVEIKWPFGLAGLLLAYLLIGLVAWRVKVFLARCDDDPSP